MTPSDGRMRMWQQRLSGVLDAAIVIFPLKSVLPLVSSCRGEVPPAHNNAALSEEPLSKR